MDPKQQAEFDVVRKYWDVMDRSLIESDSPRDWLLASFSILDHDDRPDDLSPHRATGEQSGQILRKAAEAAPDDPLVQWAWARAAYSGCDAQRPCPDRTMALAKLEPDNAAAWVPVIDEALSTNDIPKAEAGFAHMATATRYDDRFIEAALVFRKIYRRYQVPAAAIGQPLGIPDVDIDEPTTPESLQDYASKLSAREVTEGEPNGVSISPSNLCSSAQYPNAPVARFRDCVHIGRLMLNHSNSINANFEARKYLSGSGLANAADREAARVFAWQDYWYQEYRKGEKDPGLAVRIHDWFADIEETRNELEARRRSLTRRGIPVSPPGKWQPTYGVLGVPDIWISR